MKTQKITRTLIETEINKIILVGTSEDKTKTIKYLTTLFDKPIKIKKHWDETKGGEALLFTLINDDIQTIDCEDLKQRGVIK